MCPFSHGTVFICVIFLLFNINISGTYSSPVNKRDTEPTFSSFVNLQPRTSTSTIPQKEKDGEGIPNQEPQNQKYVFHQLRQTKTALFPHKKEKDKSHILAQFVNYRHQHLHKDEKLVPLVNYANGASLVMQFEHKENGDHVNSGNDKHTRQGQFTQFPLTLNTKKIDSFVPNSCFQCKLRILKLKNRLKYKMATGAVLKNTHTHTHRPTRTWKFSSHGHKIKYTFRSRNITHKALHNSNGSLSRTKRSLKRMLTSSPRKKRRRSKSKAEKPTVNKKLKTRQRRNTSDGSLNITMPTSQAVLNSVNTIRGGKPEDVKRQTRKVDSRQAKNNASNPEPNFLLQETPRTDSEVAGQMLNNGTYLGLDGKPVDLKKLATILKQGEFLAQLNRESQWAYLCLVLLLCLMMWMLWCLGGFQRCRYRPDSTIRFQDKQPLVSVKEVLMRQRKYLPMFNEPEWEEVLVCDRGNNP